LHGTKPHASDRSIAVTSRYGNKREGETDCFLEMLLLAHRAAGSIPNDEGQTTLFELQYQDLTSKI
jgi:hypothetical protein